MRIHFGFDIAMEFTQATPMLMMLNVHPSRRSDLIVPDSCASTPTFACRPMSIRSAIDARVWSRRPGASVLDQCRRSRIAGLPTASRPKQARCRLRNCRSETLIYLLGSRYCETDALSQTAWNLFGNVRPGWTRVQRIVDFVHDHLEFGYPHARATRTAFEAFNERRGVCRDFAHLAVTLCRCMNIPARYATGYLGDIGVPHDPSPMDFSAWFEVYLDGDWYSFDARHNEPRIGRIVMAYGRDAADVALTNSFGSHYLSTFEVWTKEIPTGAELPRKLIAA